MEDQKGFSLTEVLVSLLLLTGMGTMLMKQSWQINQSFNQTYLLSQSIIEQDNRKESAACSALLSIQDYE